VGTRARWPAGDDRDWDDTAASWRIDAAADARRREWWLRQQAAESSTMAGLLVDLAEQGRVVNLTLVGGRVRTGRLWGLTDDVLGLRSAPGVDVLVARGALFGVRRGPGHGPDLVGDPARRRLPTGPLATVLAAWSGDEPEVQLLDPTGAGVAGRLLRVGLDLAVVATGTGPATAVALDRVAEAVLLEPDPR
jgi:hypothetical protein